MRTLLVGHGSREAALAASIAHDSELFSLAKFENPTLKKLSSELRTVAHYAVRDVIQFAKDVRPDFVMIGPEDILALGVSDALESAGYWTCGPSKTAARLESDKLFARTFLSTNLPFLNVPYVVARNEGDVQRFFADPPWPVAIKPTGLSGGKAVRVQGVNLVSDGEAADYATGLIAEGRGPVLFERKVSGVEFTLHCVTDGEHTAFFRATYDYSYRYPADFGPQTGGMGSYCDKRPNLPFMTEDEYDRCCGLLLDVLSALRKEGIRYEGILQGQFFLSPEGFKICEFACRFGDPEATNLLPTLVSSWVHVMAKMKDREIADGVLVAKSRASVTVCLVPPDYPSALQTDRVFTLSQDALFLRIRLRSFRVHVDRSRMAFNAVADVPLR
jgi:phosphoribosylamine--glycine ligase